MIQFYKPKPAVTGSACSFYLNDSENSFFASIIKQKSWDKERRRASFEKDDPKKKVIVKFSRKEICGIIDAIKRNVELSGYHGSNQIVKFRFGPYMRDDKQLGFSFMVHKESKEDSTDKASFAIGFDFPESVELTLFLTQMVARSFDNERKSRAKQKKMYEREGYAPKPAPASQPKNEAEIW